MQNEEADSALHRLVEGQQVFVGLLRSLLRATPENLDAAINDALSHLGAFCRVDRAYVFRFRGSETVYNSHEWCAEGIEPMIEHLQSLDFATVEPWIARFREDRVIDIPNVADLPDDSPEKAVLEMQDIKAVVAVPLTDGYNLTGFLGFDAVAPRAPFNAGEVALLRSAADAIGTHLFRHEAERIAEHARESARAAEAARMRLGRIVEVMTNLVIVVDSEGRVVWVNRPFEQQTGFTLEELRGKSLAPIVRGPESDPDVVAAVSHALATRTSFEGEMINYDRHGVPYWVRFNIQPIVEPDGNFAGHVSVETVITDRKRLEEELEDQRRLFLSVLRTSMSAIVATDADGQIVFANDEAERVLRLRRRAGEAVAYDQTEWPLEHENGSPVPADTLPHRLVLERGEEQRGLRYRLRLPNGGWRLISVNAANLPRPVGGAEVVLTATDITAEDESARNLERLALEDTLTTLPNRRALSEQASKMLAEARSRGETIAVLMLDIDNFKSVNDTMRHEAGDTVLRAMAERLRAIVGEGTLLARMGGDEFMLLARGMNLEAAERLAQNIRHAVSRPITLREHQVAVTVSVGVVMFPEHGEEWPGLMTAADIALFEAKRGGRNRHAVLTQAVFNKEERRSAVVRALGRCLDEGRLSLVFQPQFDLDSPPRMIGAEALLRWNDPELGAVGPAEFIPLAEETGMVREIDRRVIQLASEQAAKWRRAGLRSRVSVNISAQFMGMPGISEMLLATLRRAGLGSTDMSVELTETSMALLTPTARENIAHLRKAGMEVSVDDFGTGYSSLSYLHKMELSELKIDRSFVQTIGEPGESGGEEIIRAIIAITRALGLRSVAEGVETETQLDWLRREGCDAVQGYLCGAPLSVDAFEARFMDEDTREAR
ncbi:MAG: EAL domain-containing protein [Rhodobacteraceae bacterium]|nr:EAL domain-containing protein [Paracoccaceae bacterium]